MRFAKDKEVNLGSIDEPLMSGNALRKSIRQHPIFLSPDNWSEENIHSFQNNDQLKSSRFWKL